MSKALGLATFVLVAFSQAAMYEAERYEQPEQFGSLDDSLWFAAVTVTTVGYGDITPKTIKGIRLTRLVNSAKTRPQPRAGPRG